MNDRDYAVTGSELASTGMGTVEYTDMGEGQPVLFLHGSPGGCDQGAAMTTFLVDAGFRVIAPSRPGYLRTPLTDQTRTPEQQAGLFLALIDSLGIDRFGLMSWSGGGPSSYLLARQHPERVPALVQLASVSKAFDFELGFDERMMLGRLGSFVMDQMAEHTPKTLIESLLGSEGDLTKSELAALADHVMAHDEKREFVLALSRTVTKRKEGLGNDLQQYAELPDLGLPGVRVPTLLVHGAADTDVLPVHSEHAAEQLPESQLVTVEGGTHLCVWTDYTSAQLQSRATAFLAAGSDDQAAEG